MLANCFFLYYNELKKEKQINLLKFGRLAQSARAPHSH